MRGRAMQKIRKMGEKESGSHSLDRQELDELLRAIWTWTDVHKFKADSVNEQTYPWSERHEE